MSETEIRERVTNNLLLLYLIELTNEWGNLEDELKLQKMVFLSQKKLVKTKLKAFSYNFFRWIKGPFSKNLRIDLLDLARANFLRVTRNKIELTKKAKSILEDCAEVFDENRDFLKHINAVIERYAKFPPDVLKDHVYSLKLMVPKIRELMSVKQIPLGKLVLFKSSDKKSRAIFHIDSARLVTLELNFDIQAISSLERAMDDAVEGRAHELEI